MRIRWWHLISLWVALLTVGAEEIPRRATDAPSGSAVSQVMAGLGLQQREEFIFTQVCAGNVPDFWRNFCPLTLTNSRAGMTNLIEVSVAPDYLALGCDDDYLLTPVSPMTAQRIADRFGFVLPTCSLVDAIWRLAPLKLEPLPLTPGADMVTVGKYVEHNSILHTQRMAFLKQFPLGTLVAGHKKDLVWTPSLMTQTNRVAIYGWHRTNGQPIQPLYLGHVATWVDYSHGVRFVRNLAKLDGQPMQTADLITNVAFSIRDSEGPHAPRSPIAAVDFKERVRSSDAPQGFNKLSARASKPEFKTQGRFGERTATFDLQPEIRVMINLPPVGKLAANKRRKLVVYALPNGNTIEQTVGKQLHRDDDWHFNIQHIGAQTRWLRARMTNESLAVAYLESSQKSWPAWIREHSPSRVPEIVSTIASLLPEQPDELVLASHSGGGSFVCGYLTAVREVPENVRRICFLDSNYAYRTTNHCRKISDWIARSTNHVLCVFAYQDYLGLLDGKPFVSEKGGTWGRSIEMLRDLSGFLNFESTVLGEDLTWRSSPQHQVNFLLWKNPNHKVLHSLQVERNGFIHALLLGTTLENLGYHYLGERTYSDLIE